MNEELRWSNAQRYIPEEEEEEEEEEKSVNEEKEEEPVSNPYPINPLVHVPRRVSRHSIRVQRRDPMRSMRIPLNAMMSRNDLLNYSGAIGGTRIPLEIYEEKYYRRMNEMLKTV